MCNLASIALNRYVKPGPTFDFKQLEYVTGITVRNLNKIIEINFYPVEEVRNVKQHYSYNGHVLDRCPLNPRWKSSRLSGMQGFHGYEKSWIVKPSWKVMEKSWNFVFLQEVMENSYFKTKQTISTIQCGYGSLLVCIYKLTTFFHAYSMVSV